MMEASEDDFRHIRCLHQIWCGGFDVILVIGQSNATSRGLARRPMLEEPNDRIYQIGRESMDFIVVPAVEPLSHLTSAAQGMGFALPFARYYRDEFLEPKRSVLIVPCAKGATAVAVRDGYWRPGGEGHEDVRARLGAALHPYRDSRLAAILWHQGENDAGSDQDLYRRLAAELLTGIRDEFAEAETPIILGELALSIRQTKPAEMVNESIHHLVGAIPNAGLALSTQLLTRGEMAGSEEEDIVHFNANSQLELGKRYFLAYVRLTHPEHRLATHPHAMRFTSVPNAPEPVKRDPWD